MNRWSPAVLVAVTVFAGSCGQGPSGTTTELDVPYRADATLDIHIPSRHIPSRHIPSRPAPPRPRMAPVVVTLHGCCGGKEDLTGLAHRLATEGALVFNASWRSPTGPGGYPAAYERAACAVRFARAQATSRGGDPSRVTVVGWSDGALVAAVVANAGDELARGCYAPEGSGADTVVSLGGFLGWPVGPDGAVDPTYVNEGTIRYFGGTPEEKPEAWRAGNAYAQLGRRSQVELRLVVGADDPLAEGNRRFADAARAAGHPVSLTVVPGAGQTVTAPRTPDGALAVREVLAAARQTPTPQSRAAQSRAAQ